ncbi:hypothetical protein D3C77_753390 [compost metagenome]
MQLAGDHRALLEDQQAVLLLALAFQRQRGADQVGQRLDQFHFPRLGKAAIGEVGA